MSEDNTYQRRFVWRQTFPDTPDDGVAKDPEASACTMRVYKQVASSTQLPWYWTASNTHHIASGYAATKDEAIQFSETAYLSVKPKQAGR